MNLKIIFSNNHFIAVAKPALTLSVPSRMGQNDERFCVGTELQKQLGKQVYPVHRLDFEVSGLLLFALDAKAHRQACLWFEHDLIHKKYQAISEGVAPKWQKESWHSKLLKGMKRAYEAPHGKDSQTEVEFLFEKNGLLHWDLAPVTGRSHQLRFEMFKHQFPICGDELYGSKQTFERGIALCSYLLDFSDCPESLTFQLPPKILLDSKLF